MPVRLSGDIPNETLVNQTLQRYGLEADPSIVWGADDIKVMRILHTADCEVADTKSELDRALVAFAAAQGKHAEAQATQQAAVAEFEARRRQKAEDLSRAAGQLAMETPKRPFGGLLTALRGHAGYLTTRQ